MEKILFYDLETTDKDPEKARIVQYSFHMVPTSFGIEASKHEKKTGLINPGITIPAESIMVHGITDEMVKGQPRFASVAKELLQWINEADAIGGYNNRQYDDVVIEHEFARIGISLDLKEKPCLDVFAMLNRFFPRTLVGMVKLLLGVDMEAQAHDADADTKYTVTLARELLMKGEGIKDISKINDLLYPGELDRGGKLVFNEDGEVVFGFGKYDQKKTTATLRDVVSTDYNYLNWMLGQDFPSDFKKIIRDAIKGSYPETKTDI